jgi:hypothetical protein
MRGFVICAYIYVHNMYMYIFIILSFLLLYIMLYLRYFLSLMVPDGMIYSGVLGRFMKVINSSLNTSFIREIFINDGTCIH